MRSGIVCLDVLGAERCRESSAEDGGDDVVETWSHGGG